MADFFEDARNAALEFININRKNVEQGRDAISTFMGWDKSGNFYGYNVVMYDGEAPGQVYEQMQTFIVWKELVGVVYTGEACMVERSLDAAPTGDISKEPDRREILFAFIRSEERGLYLRSTIFRGDPTTTSDVVELEGTKNGYGSPLCDLCFLPDDFPGVPPQLDPIFERAFVGHEIFTVKRKDQ